VRSIAIRYIRPAQIEDALSVRTSVAGLTGARMLLDQWISRDQEEMTRADVEVCLISAAGRPRRIPDAIRQRMEFYVEKEDNRQIREGRRDA
jgi:acyl-CoA thioesterase FadM